MTELLGIPYERLPTQPNRSVELCSSISSDDEPATGMRSKSIQESLSSKKLSTAAVNYGSDSEDVPCHLYVPIPRRSSQESLTSFHSAQSDAEGSRPSSPFGGNSSYGSSSGARSPSTNSRSRNTRIVELEEIAIDERLENLPEHGVGAGFYSSHHFSDLINNSQSIQDAVWRAWSKSTQWPDFFDITRFSMPKGSKNGCGGECAHSMHGGFMNSQDIPPFIPLPSKVSSTMSCISNRLRRNLDVFFYNYVVCCMFFSLWTVSLYPLAFMKYVIIFLAYALLFLYHENEAIVLFNRLVIYEHGKSLVLLFTLIGVLMIPVGKVDAILVGLALLCISFTFVVLHAMFYEHDEIQFLKAKLCNQSRNTYVKRSSSFNELNSPRVATEKDAGDDSLV